MKSVFSFVHACRYPALLLLVTALTGCGTIVNHLPVKVPREEFDADGRPYGGVRWDLIPWKMSDTSGGTIIILDVPCSFVGDTLMLPYDLTRKH